MKFKYRKQVHVGFRSGNSITVYCDQILFKQSYFARIVFLYKGMEICDCLFNEVSLIEYFESLFSMDATPIDKFDIMCGNLVDCIQWEVFMEEFYVVWLKESGDVLYLEKIVFEADGTLCVWIANKEKAIPFNIEEHYIVDQILHDYFEGNIMYDYFGGNEK